MIDEEMPNARDIKGEKNHIADTTDDEISKSQRKRDADSIRDLGLRLTELGASELTSIALPDDVMAAIEEYSRIKAHGARKRQLGFLAKRLRHVDIEPIDAALEKIRQSARANTMSLHMIEHWRDRLLGVDEKENAKDALTNFFTDYPHADRQKLRHLQARALREQQRNQPPAAARQLIKEIRDLVTAEPDK